MIRNGKEIKKIVIKDENDNIIAIITDSSLTSRADINIYIDDEKKQ